MLVDSLFFKLFAHCIPVKGAKRSVICDVQRRKIDFIPNALFDLLVANKHHSVGAIKEKYGRENENIIEEYFNFLIEKEYLFLCDKEELELFPDLDLHWEVPCQIENAIIDAQEGSDHPYATIFQQLENLGCQAIQFRFFYPQKYQQLIDTLDLLKGSRIEAVEIITPYTPEFTEERLLALAENYPRLSDLTLHSAPSADAITFQHDYLNCSCTTKKIDSHAHCGLIAPRFFSITLDTFLESQQHNNCLNHKISIDAEGYIKNCPSLPKSYGHIANSTLAEALQQPGFKEFWKVSKDQIAVCRDCEFRYICTDCRAYVKDSKDAKSQPLKCGYNPYTNEWKAWSEHPLKASAMASS